MIFIGMACRPMPSRQRKHLMNFARWEARLKANINKMLNPKLQLNPKVWNDDVEQIPIRQGFGEGLLVAAGLDENIVGLCADLTESTRMNLFADRYPKRFVQVGV